MGDQPELKSFNAITEEFEDILEELDIEEQAKVSRDPRGVTLEIDGDLYTMSITMMGQTEQITGAFSEIDGNPCIDGECLPIIWEASGQIWSSNMTSDAYCEDYDEVELPDYADRTSCEDLGNYWYDESCTITVWSKQ